MRVGSDAPVVVQSMTNTDTADIPSTVEQVAALARAGSELVRVTVNNEDAASAVAPIVDELDKQGIHVPIIGDFHYNGHLLLKKYPDCARALAKYRINPGNVSVGRKDDDNFRTMIEVAVKNQKPVRIGVNWGSLDQRPAHPHDGREFPAARAQRRPRSHHGSHGRKRVELGRTGGKIRPASRPDHPQRESQRRAGFDRRLPLARRALRLPAAPRTYRSRHGRERHRRLQPPHSQCSCRKASATPFASRSRPRPDGDRTEEVRVGQQILQSLGIRSFTPQVTACPGCGRTTSTFFQEMAEQIQTYLREQMPIWKDRYPGVEEMKVAVMGCVVNGPGESKHASLGISLPGTFEEPKAPVYVDGRLFTTLKGDNIVAEFIADSG